MSDVTFRALPFAAGEAHTRPSFARGLIWGSALALLLWSGLGYLAAGLL
ncbi:MAG TPA: hypothetical protein VNZ61_00055 [Roseomonas sp.]|nr:hypothetical protein [Roseomonas sp.]